MSTLSKNNKALKELSEENLSPERVILLHKLEEKIQYKFSNIAFLEKALRHRSFYPATQGKDVYLYNQRLEFLGDSILGAVIAEFLFLEFPYKKEGDLSKIKSKIVSGDSLFQLGQSIDLFSYICMGKGERKAGKKAIKIIEDAVESIIGAVFLDSGYQGIKNFIKKFFKLLINDILRQESTIDFKSLLQESTHKKYQKTPVYKLINSNENVEPAEFTMAVFLNREELARANGNTKKKAAQNAAYKALSKYYIKDLKKHGYS